MGLLITLPLMGELNIQGRGNELKTDHRMYPSKYLQIRLSMRYKNMCSLSVANVGGRSLQTAKNTCISCVCVFC